MYVFKYNKSSLKLKKYCVTKEIKSVDVRKVVTPTKQQLSKLD